jgi:hypothetical protein
MELSKHLIAPFSVINGLILFLAFSYSSILNSQNSSHDLFEHIHLEKELTNSSGLDIQLMDSKSEGLLNLKMQSENKKTNYAWASVPAPKKGWTLNSYNYIEADIKNTSSHPVQIILWIKANKGWNAVADTATIKAGDIHHFKCDLRETFPDKTPKLNPDYVHQIQVMFVKPKPNVSVDLLNLVATGKLSKWERPKDRMDVPDITTEKPKAGKRTIYKLDNDKHPRLYAALYLPSNWKPNKKHPVIVEFPGNIFFTKNCYSTGRPEDSVMGYGMSMGEDAIWICMPFVDYKSGEITVNGWGNPDDTANYTQKIVQDIIKKYSGDANNVVLTGFSRGAIACGFIGLRNDSIASLWKGLHMCQHYDGDGWNGADMGGALKRIQRLNNKKVFHTDNNGVEPRKMLSKVNADVTFTSSGLKYHACDMFLDNRPSTLQLRQWFKYLVSN